METGNGMGMTAKEEQLPPQLHPHVPREAQEERERRNFPLAKGGAWSGLLETYEAQQGRKWKLRCARCASPMGSWSVVRNG